MMAYDWEKWEIIDYRFVDERRFKCMNLQGGGVYRIGREIHVWWGWGV